MASPCDQKIDSASFGLQKAPDRGRWTAIVLAGERPGGDPLARELAIPAKALIVVEGKTLINRVITALLQSAEIARIVVLAQDTQTLMAREGSGILSHARVTLMQSGNGIATSIMAIAGTGHAPWPVLVTTADNALLTTARVDTFLSSIGALDIAVGVGERRIVEREFPKTRRTWLKFSDGQFSGANLFALRTARCRNALAHWADIEVDRKRGLKLIASFGAGLLFRVLTRTIVFEAALAEAGHRLGGRAAPVVLDAEAPIDVDKMSDLQLVREILARRQGGETNVEQRASYFSPKQTPFVAGEASKTFVVASTRRWGSGHPL